MLNLHSSMGKLSHPFKIGKFPARPPRSRLLCSSQGFSVTASSSHSLPQRFLCRPQFCFRAAVTLALRNTTKTASYAGQSILPLLMRKIYAPVKLEKRYQAKQISPGSSNQGIVFNLKKIDFCFQVSIHVYPRHPQQQTTGNSSNAFTQSLTLQ